MDLKEVRLSDNFEIDCLGLRTHISSPAADAALACQGEVQQLRSAYEAMPYPKSALKVGSFNGFVDDVVDNIEKDEKGSLDNVVDFFRHLTAGGKRLVTDPQLFDKRTQSVKTAYEYQMELFKTDRTAAMTIHRRTNDPFYVP